MTLTRDEYIIEQVGKISACIEFIEKDICVINTKLDLIDTKISYLNVGNALFKKHIEEHKEQRNKFIFYVGFLATIISGAIGYIVNKL